MDQISLPTVKVLRRVLSSQILGDGYIKLDRGRAQPINRLALNFFGGENTRPPEPTRSDHRTQYTHQTPPQAFAQTAITLLISALQVLLFRIWRCRYCDRRRKGCKTSGPRSATPRSWQIRGKFSLCGFTPSHGAHAACPCSACKIISPIADNLW
jgi:hypothetical protein